MTAHQCQKDGIFDQLTESTITVEHGFICLRSATGWLLWSGALADAPPDGWAVAEMVDQAKRELAHAATSKDFA